MIPPDIATRVRLLMQEFLREQAPGAERVSALHQTSAEQPFEQELPDELREGSYVRATIQRPLPNGTYLALVAGREMTLAIDRALKSGDALELLITERGAGQLRARALHDAQLASLALPQKAAGPLPQAISATTSLSALGQVLRQILTNAPEPGPLPLRLLPPDPRSPQQMLALFQQAQEPKEPPLPSGSASPLQALPASSAEKQAAARIGTNPLQEAPQNLSATAQQQTARALSLQDWLAINARLSAQQAPATPQQLAESLARSGLFYESHLARWVEGTLSLEAVLAEPQAQGAFAAQQPSHATLSAPPSGEGAAWLGRIAEAIEELFSAESSVEKASLHDSGAEKTSFQESGAGKASFRETPSGGSERPMQADSGRLLPREQLDLSESAPFRRLESAQEQTLPVAERFMPLVQRQLEALAQQRLDFVLIPWSQALVRWQIEAPLTEERESSASLGKEEAQRWRSTLAIQSALLGRVVFVLDYSQSQGLAMAISAEKPETAALLRARSRELLDALAADQLRLAALTWRPYEATSEPLMPG